MGLEDPAADSGAEITSLKTSQKSLITELEVSPWSAVDLLGEKKKEQLLSYDPVYYPVKGAEPEAIQSDPKIEFQASKRSGSSSLARQSVDESVGTVVPITGINPKVGSPMLQKNPADIYSPLIKSGGAEGISIDKKLTQEHLSSDKILTQEHLSSDKILTQEHLFSDKKLSLSDQAFPARSGGSLIQKLDNPQFGATTSAVPLEGLKPKGFGMSAQNFAVTESQLSPLAKPQDAKLVPIGPEKQLIAPSQGGGDWSQAALLKSSQGGAGAGELKQLTGQKALEVTPTTFVSPGQKFEKFEKFEIPAGQNANQLSQELSKTGGEPKFGSAIAKHSEFVQTQIHLSVEQKLTSAGQPKLGSALQQPVETSGELKGGSLVQSKATPLAQTQLDSAPLRAQTIAQARDIKLDQPALRAEPGNNRIAAQQAETAAHQTEPFVATAGNGTAKKFAADVNSTGDLPAKLSKASPVLTQVDKLTGDAQLRAQTDRIAAGAPVRGQADLPQTVKLKGEITTAAVRQPDVQVSIKAGQQLETAPTARLSPLKDRIAATTLVVGAELSHTNDRRNAAVSASSLSPIASLLANIKEGRGVISRTPAFDHLLSAPVKNTGDRYVGGEFILASMIIAAGAARRMPEQRLEGQVQSHNGLEGAKPRQGDNVLVANNSSQTAKVSPFNQIVDTIARAFTPGKTNDQTASLDASRRLNLNQGQNDSVRYISGVELAILLAAGGVTRLRSERSSGQSQQQSEAATKTTPLPGANIINFNTGKQPLEDTPDTHITTRIARQMSGQRSELTPPFLPPSRLTDTQVNAISGDKKNQRPQQDLVVRGERCIPGADIAVAAMLMLGGVTRKRSEGRLPANPDELAQRVDKPFRLDRRLGALVEQAKSFVWREPLPVSGLRNTAADLVSKGEVSLPQQYRQAAQEQNSAASFAWTQFAPNRLKDNLPAPKAKLTLDTPEALPAPTGWVHEPVFSKEQCEEACEEKLKKVEQDQQRGSGANAAAALYRPIWIIAPGETFVSIAEDHFGDGSIAWLIADLNIGKFQDNFVDGKRVIEIQSRQKIELPVAGDIEEFRQNRKRHQDAENIITIVTASQLDIELKQATFKQFLGTLQSRLPVPALAILPDLSLEIPSQIKPARAISPFGTSAPQFASIAAAVYERRQRGRDRESCSE